jgi:hypothetical protein
MNEHFQSRGGVRMYRSLKKRPNRTLLGAEFQAGISVKDCLDTTYFMKIYMSKCRGLQYRNWRNVCADLKQMGCKKELLDVIYHSWVKFKFARALRPSMQSTYVYILKNFSDLEGQKIYDDCYEQYTEQPEGTTRVFYDRRGKDSRYYRLLEYFYNEQPEWILPLTVFPRIDFEKSKMHYSDEPYEINGDLIKEVHEKVFNYIMKLDIKKLFIPRGDLMQKYGSQRYNDGGVVRFDYERPSNSFDSSFKYQRFLTQPLTPREVWLPGKAIKQNNAFFMNVHRQILEKDPIYPSLIMEENHTSLLPHIKEGMWGFDISGFGFQFIREWLIAGNNAIRELYPCSQMEEQSEIFEQILGSVSVEMPNGEIKHPKRGIGLGYYEDLKTIVMMALLDDHYPISIYGDQGLIEKKGIEFAFELMKYSFIMNYEKLDEKASEKQLRWGGIIFDSDHCIRPRIYTDSIFGAFFSRHHWERKSSLQSVCKHYPEMYKSIEKRIVNMYDRIFGYEFFKGEHILPFEDGGLCLKPRVQGVSKLYNIRNHSTPENAMVFDPIYQTPFQLVNKSSVTFKESKRFSKMRKNLYKTQSAKDTMLYDYVNPEIEFNKKQPLLPRSLPRWADINLILGSNMSSGALTSGLWGEEIQKAAERQYFSSDPFRARATGGYSFITKWRSSRPPPQELLETAEVLKGCETTDTLYVSRNDLYQERSMGEDPFYYNTDLFSRVIEIADKRKATRSNVGSIDEKRLQEEVFELLPSMIKRRKVNDFAGVIALAEQVLDNYDRGYEIMSQSDHGFLENDDDFYADAIDLVDL